jgi:hypothetical protein
VILTGTSGNAMVYSKKRLGDPYCEGLVMNLRPLDYQTR